MSSDKTCCITFSGVAYRFYKTINSERRPYTATCRKLKRPAQNYAVSLVEDLYTGDSAQIATHELAHK